MPADVHPDDELDATVQRADLDELVRLIDRRTELRDWNGLVRTRRADSGARYRTPAMARRNSRRVSPCVVGTR